MPWPASSRVHKPMPKLAQLRQQQLSAASTSVTAKPVSASMAATLEDFAPLPTRISASGTLSKTKGGPDGKEGYVIPKLTPAAVASAAAPAAALKVASSAVA